MKSEWGTTCVDNVGIWSGTSMISIFQLIQPWVVLRWGISCMIEFLHDRSMSLARKFCLYLVLSFTCFPCPIGSHSTDKSKRLGIACKMFFQKFRAGDGGAVFLGIVCKTFSLCKRLRKKWFLWILWVLVKWSLTYFF